MPGDLTITEAVLAAAAAQTTAEEHLARLALIGCGAQILRPIDRTLLIAGDGTAGGRVLGGPFTASTTEPSAVRRSNRIRATARALAAGGGELS